MSEMTDCTEPAAAAVARQMVDILDQQARLMRSCWNVLKSDAHMNAEVAYRLAAMMSTVGAALENFPEDLRRFAPVTAASADDGRMQAEMFMRECAFAVDFLSSLTIDPLICPGEARSEFDAYGLLCTRWRSFCEALAGCAGVEPHYGVRGKRLSTRSQEPELWFTRLLARSVGWFGRRSRFFRSDVATAWFMIVSQFRSLSPGLHEEMQRISYSRPHIFEAGTEFGDGQ